MTISGVAALSQVCHEVALALQFESEVTVMLQFKHEVAAVLQIDQCFVSGDWVVLLLFQHDNL